MSKERSQKEQVKAAIAEFAAAFEKGQRERMAAFLAPEARLYVHNANGTQEIVGASAASRSLKELSGHAQVRFGAAKIQLKAGGAASVEAKLENFEVADASKYGAQAHAARSTYADAHEAHATQAHAVHTIPAHEVHAEAGRMISAELEMQGEQWRVKEMHYRAM